MKKTLSGRGLLAVAFASLLATPSLANDWQFFGNRGSLMGGAGLALPVFPHENLSLNPAFRAFNRGFNFNVPSLKYESRRVSYNELRDYLGDPDEAALGNADDLIRFGKKLGGDDTRFGVGTDFGFLYNGFSIGASGQASVLGKPNAELRAWVNSGAAGDPPPGARFDAYGLGFYSIDLGYGDTVPVKNGSLALGGTVKFVNGYYGHKIVTYNGDDDTANVDNGADAGGRDSVSERGVGFDLGSVFSSAAQPNLYYGVVIENLIEPNMRFDRQVPNGGPILRNDIHPFKRALNFGVGHVSKEGKVLLAADALDFGNNAGRSSLALGAQYNVSRAFGVGAGFNSRTGFTVGVSVYGINIAYANRSPQVGYSLRF